MSNRIGVILIEDHMLVRQSLRLVFETSGDIEVAGEADSAELGLKLLEETACDVVILDLNLPNESGSWCAERISELHPGLPILILSMHAQRSVVVDLVRAGARGFVSKASDLNELITGVRALAAGGSFFDSRAAGAVLDCVRGHSGTDSGLSVREEQILRMVCQGKSNHVIAERMSLSVSSIKNHLRALFVRFEATDRASLVNAYETLSRYRPQQPPR